MSDPIVSVPDLATYLNDPTIDSARAEAMINDAQALAETVVSPLPAAASVIVKRIAARAYVSTMTTRTSQMIAAGSQIGAMPLGMGGIYLTRGDRADLRRLTGGGAAFTINPLPAGYALDVPPWDFNGAVGVVETS
jgi:hypothetical protein